MIPAENEYSWDLFKHLELFDRKGHHKPQTHYGPRYRPRPNVQLWPQPVAATYVVMEDMQREFGFELQDDEQHEIIQVESAEASLYHRADMAPEKLCTSMGPATESHAGCAPDGVHQLHRGDIITLHFTFDLAALVGAGVQRAELVQSLKGDLKAADFGIYEEYVASVRGIANGR